MKIDDFYKLSIGCGIWFVMLLISCALAICFIFEFFF